MSDDLVSRLKRLARIARRALETNKCMSIWCADPDTLDEAATALTEARAEIERLQERVFELKHGVKDQMEEAAYHKQKRDTAESELSTLRARVREVVGPFATLAQQYDDTVSDGWISWTEFITDHDWPSELDCRAARQLMEEVK